MSRPRALIVIPVFTLFIAACGNGNPADTSPSSAGGPAAASPVSGVTANVTIDEQTGSAAGFQFQPTPQSAKVGQVVEWVNKSAILHNVTFDDSSMPASAQQNAGDTYQLKFTAGGKFTYQCTIHPGMTGEIDITP